MLQYIENSPAHNSIVVKMDELNPTEQQVLLGLIEQPQLTDTRLAAHLDLNRSTFASTKSALRKRKAFRTIMLPNYGKLGFELLMVASASLSASIDYKVRRHSWRGVHGTHAHFFTLSDPEKLLTMVFGRNFTQLQHRVDLFEYQYDRGKFLDSATLDFYFFPLALSKLHVYLDWTNIMRTYLGLELSRVRAPPLDPQPGPELNLRQMAVLKALVQEPEANLGQIAKLAKVSRLTATKIREWLLEEGLLIPRVVLSPRPLGYSIWAYVRLPFRPGSTIDQRREVTSQVLPLAPLVYFEKKQEAVGIFLHRDLETYDRTLTTLSRLFEGSGHLASKPVSHLFLLSNIKYSSPYNFAANLEMEALPEDPTRLDRGGHPGGSRPPGPQIPDAKPPGHP